MVCIIDDREDVWNFASNLIHVKPYQFFKGVGDINAPPGSSPPEEEEEEEEEENTSSGKPVDVDIQEGDVRTEEPNSVESEGVEEEKDAVFEENIKSEETKGAAMSEEKGGFENSSQSVEANLEKQDPVVDTSEDGNNATKGIDETVEINKDSSKVLENGGNDSTDDESKQEESNETKTLRENNPEGEQNYNGKTEGVEEQSNDKVTCKEPQLWSEGGECHVYLTVVTCHGFFFI